MYLKDLHGSKSGYEKSQDFQGNLLSWKPNLKSLKSQDYRDITWSCQNSKDHQNLVPLEDDHLETEVPKNVEVDGERLNQQIAAEMGFQLNCRADEVTKSH